MTGSESVQTTTNKCREEVVGKRFLSVSGGPLAKSGKIGEWAWRAGVIRAATHRDNAHPELQVLVEYDDVEWHRREWISIYKDKLFHLFMVEQGLVWAERRDPYTSTQGTILWPALTFAPLVSTVDLTSQLQPVEFLLDRELAFKDYKQLKPFQEWDPSLPGVRDYPDLRTAVRRWAEQQDGQRILLTTPSVLVGYRVEVYRAEGTTQWYTAVIIGYNEATRDLTVTDDTVLEEHNEDPTLVQMRLIGDGVVESIMRGENVGITPRRSRSAVLQTQHQQQPSRVVRGVSQLASVGLRKARSGKPTQESVIQCFAPEPPDKGSTGKARKRKTSESECGANKVRNNYTCDLDSSRQNRNRKGGVCNSNSAVNNGRGTTNVKKVVEDETGNGAKFEGKEVLNVCVENCLQDPTIKSIVDKRQQDLQDGHNHHHHHHHQRVVVAPPPTTDCSLESDSILDDTSNGSSVQLVPVEVVSCCGDDVHRRDDSVPETVTGDVVSEEEDEEDDCVVIVAQQRRKKATTTTSTTNTSTPSTTTTTTTTTIPSPTTHKQHHVEQRECSSRGDDDGPLSSSSPFNRMELADPSNAASLRFPDDRSDSGVSSLRSGSGDERSGSRSSALSSSDEPHQQPPQHINNNNNVNPSTIVTHHTSSNVNRSLYLGPSNHQNVTNSTTAANSSSSSGQSDGAEPVRVWRDPNLLLESEPHVRHIHSVQHQSLLMSHPSTPAASGPPSSSSSSASASVAAAAAAAAAAVHPAASMYPPVPPPPPTLMGPHPLQHPHLAPPGLYPPPHHLTDMLWKQRYSLPVNAAAAAHLLASHGAHPTATEEIIERERAALMQERERLMRDRQNQEVRELEKHKEREKERMERERQEREREREKQEREKQEKERQQQALQNHFEKSLRQAAAQQKRDQWNPIGTRSQPPSISNNSEDDRKRNEQELHQREQRHMAVRSERDHRAYYSTSQRPSSVPGKNDYPPPPAHSRISTNKPTEKMAAIHSTLSKSELNVFGYPVYQPYFPNEPKNKSDHHKMSHQSGLVVTKTGPSPALDRDVHANSAALMNEMKNSVIVKHDAKSQHHLEPRVSMAHSPSPKLRTEMIAGHYLQSTNQPKSGLYEYRSPTQSPHHLSHTPSPHHHMDAQNMGGKTTHHRQSNSSQLPSPHHHQRQSPHPHSQQHHSPELRYRTTSGDTQTLIYPTQPKSSYPYASNNTQASIYTMPTAVTNSKPKVSSPAPHHIYGKPSAGIVSGIPVSRPHESANPMQLTSKPPLSSSVSPSPYQQVSQYHPPHQQSAPLITCAPPPAHSSRTTSSVVDPRCDRMYAAVGSVPAGLSVKSTMQHGTSPPTAASAPLPMSRGHPQYIPGVTLAIPQNTTAAASVQTQPLDLGVSNKYDDTNGQKRKTPVSSASSPVCLEVKKRRIDNPAMGVPLVPSSHDQVLQNQPVPMYVTSVQQQPQLARVSEPSPLIVSAATTITTVVNTAAYRSPATNAAVQNPSTLADSLPDVSVTPVNISTVDTNIRPPSAETNQLNNSITNNSTSSPAPTPPTNTTSNNGTTPRSGTESPNTPVKATAAPPPSSVDSEKSNSPGPNKTSGGSYPVRHLKKAWLQRHTGEDLEDTTGVTGSGSCVSLPIKLSTNKEGPVNSLHSIGSMAVNSINKTKHVAGRQVFPKTPEGKDAKSHSPPKVFPSGNVANKSDGRQTVRKSVGGKDTKTHTSPNIAKVFPSGNVGTKGDGRQTARKAIGGHDPRLYTNAYMAKMFPSTNATNKSDDSSSSDQDRGRKSPPKRKPPKVKRKKGSGTALKKRTEEHRPRKVSGGIELSVASESGSDSEKESGSDKDSDSGASTTQLSTGKKALGSNSTTGKEPRKRGRRPKSSKNDKAEEPRTKKTKEDNGTAMPQRDSFRKPPVGQLKKTGESFLQDGPCFEVAPKLAKCRECRWTPNQRSKNMPNIFCRFYAFRRLRYTKNGQLAIAGFSDPHKDALEDDLKLWLPNADLPPSDLDLETSKFILKQVGDHFCDLYVQEKEAHAEYMSDDKTVAWKRVVQGVREMCDVCETTLFNFHWACGKCGFVVCLDCYKSRKNGSLKIWGESGKDRDEVSWLLCTNRQPHEQEKLMLTQIIAGDSLSQLAKMVHEMRELWNIEQFCGCPASKEVAQKPNNVVYKEIIKSIMMDKANGIKKEIKDNDSGKTTQNGVVKDEKNSPLSWLADVALQNEDKKNDDNNSSDSDEGSFSTLRELLIRPSHKPNGSRAASPVPNTQKSTKKTTSKMDTLDEVISSVIDDTVTPISESSSEEKSELKHFLRRYNWQSKGRTPPPIRIMTLTESKMLYPDVPHSWLCDGKLLRLSDPINKDNYKIFQDQWRRGQPVIVSDVTRNLSKDLWSPEAFARDFGDEKNDLINCMTGNLVPNQPMRKFWEGFDHFSKRLKDDRGMPMLLKLKDWPPGEDFAEMLPSRFNDLMKVLPLSEYTHRDGRLNLASRLPDCFVRPDLGPKMYNAYGSALHPSKGTTNLHLDISDAVNVMVYVGIPKDGDSEEHIKEAFRAIDEAGCDILTRRRVRDRGELPGALWHIYNARDADKIRDLLNKVVVEKGGRLEPHNDPIHDQSCYLDGPLRERLYKEYGVEGYAIVQCLGDAVFIPAGAPHQVRNLHNCIKVAEDFVSPENVSHCFHLTQEFRELSDTHSNHEDKLQIKNIIYHAVKDALSSISSILNRHICKSEKDSNGERNGDGESGGDDSNQQMDSTETA